MVGNDNTVRYQGLSLQIPAQRHEAPEATRDAAEIPAASAIDLLDNAPR